MSYIGTRPKFVAPTCRPQSADPSNPTEGMIQYADGTARTEGLWVYSNGAWVFIGSQLANLNNSMVPFNLGLLGNAASSTMILSIKTAAGNNASASDPIYVPFRNATAATGQFSVVAITGALSATVSSGSTLAQLANVASKIHVYLINNAGTAEVAFSRVFYGFSGIISTTAEGGAGGADSGYVMYSTTARSNVPYICVGYIVSSQATPGTWATGPSETVLLPFVPEKIYAYYETNTALTVTNGATFIAEDRVSDVNNIYDSSVGNWVIPKTGRYHISAIANVNSVVGAVGNIVGLVLNKSGSESRTFLGQIFTFQTTTSIQSFISFSAPIDCVQGDTFSFSFSENVTNAMALTGTANRNWIMIQEL